jgi:hypothetical protein
MTADKFCRVPNVVTRTVAGEVLLIPVSGELADIQRVFVLNSVADCIWEHLDGSLTSREICTRVAERFEVDWETASHDVDAFLIDLASAKLIVEVA